MVGITPEEIAQIKKYILAKPIFAVVSDTCSYCTTFLRTVEKMNYSDKLFRMDEKEYGDIFAKARQIVKDVYGHRTVPIIFINGWFLGGNDKFQSIRGNLKNLLSGDILENAYVLTKKGVLLLGPSSGVAGPSRQIL